MVSGRLAWKLLLLFLASAFLIKPVFASTTDGTISSGYAWSSRIGWINFAISNGNVHVTDADLTGSAWSESYGWLKLDPSNSGVVNNGEGDLSGSAWGSNIGWVDFSGVNIGSDGIFYGTASGTNTGIINFSCTNCLVQTDWRPVSVRSIQPPSIAFPVTVPPGGAVGGGSAVIVSTSAEIESGILVSSSIKQIPKLTGSNKIYGTASKNPPKTSVTKLLTPALAVKWTYIDPQILQRFIFSPAKDNFLSIKNEELQEEDNGSNIKMSKLKIVLSKAYFAIYETKNIVGRFISSIIGDEPVICKVKVC